MRGLSTLPFCVLLSACASSSAEIRPSYVSPLQYQNLSCQQLGAEAERVSRRASEVAGVQDSNKTSDAWVTGAAIVLFWPAAFFVKGDGQTAAELARLKGEFEAIEQASIQKNCGLRFQRPAPAETSSISKKDQRAEQRRNDATN
jgi:hypothetical protein